MFDLIGKAALVTGVTGGIGKAAAQALHRQGAAVVGTGRRQDALESLASELGENFFPLECDLADEEAVAGLAARAAELTGNIAILVNCAGVTRDGLFMRLRDDDWNSVLKVNLTSAAVLSKSVLRNMMKARWGRIINVTSVVAATGNPGQTNYTASKAALTAVTKSLAAEVASRGITVNAVAPGMIETAMTDKMPEQSVASIKARIPVGRIGTSEEVAAAILFLASEEASYVTGSTLHVNGGMAMY